MLSYYLLRLNYRINNIIGVMGCLLGCGLIVLADYLVHIEDTTSGIAKHRISGDLLCFFSSILYALSNVLSEIFIKESSKLEYLSMIGFFGSLISIVQMWVKHILNKFWTSVIFWNFKVCAGAIGITKFDRNKFRFSKYRTY